MSYIKRNLIKGEKIILTAKVSLVGIVRVIIVCAIAFFCNAFLVVCLAKIFETDAGVGFFISPIILMYIGLFSILNTELALTDKKIIGKCNVIKKINVPIEYITEISVKQNWLEKNFDCGSVVITTLLGDCNFDYIKSAEMFRNAVMEQINSTGKNSKL